MTLIEDTRARDHVRPAASFESTVETLLELAPEVTR